MDGAKHRRVSKFLSYVLRHHPETIGLHLDDHGWAHIEELSEKANREGYNLDKFLIQDIIASGDKQRFILSSDKQYVRAAYGHSIEVDLKLDPKEPPVTLYHGTSRRHVSSILMKGIHSASRNFVHLSAKAKDARKVGSRHGKPVVLQVESLTMFRQDYSFFQSESEAGVWLTKEVPAAYCTIR